MKNNKCDACNGQDMEKFADDSMKKYGWYCHFVMLDDNHINAHTHGIYETYGHSDFQVVLPIDPNIIHHLFTDLVENIKKGEVYNYKKRYAEVIKNYDVTFIMRKEGCRTVKRMIFPDAKGNLERDELSCPYNHQYDMLE